MLVQVQLGANLNKILSCEYFFICPKFANLHFHNYTYSMHSIQNSNIFLWYYNKIDKFLAHLIGAKVYIPYSDKVQRIADGGYPQSKFVRLYQNKLRYFGDLRNQLVHGFSLENKHYVVASDYAVEQVKWVFKELTSPQTVSDLFTGEVYCVVLHDSLKEVIEVMRNELNTHVPVYDSEWAFVEMLSESTIAYWVADAGHESIDLSALTVADIPLENTNDTFVFVEQSRSVYEIETLFAQSFAEKKRLGAVFITEKGNNKEPITGIITAMDLPKLASSVIL